MTDKLLAHQTEGIEFLRETPRAGLYDEPGLGKSAQALLAATEPVLVMAPAMVLVSGTWDDEIARWAPGMDVTQVAYSSSGVRGPRGRVERDANGFPKVPVVPELRHRWGTVILDEAHYVKGRKTWWSSTAEQLSMLTDDLKELTGTPIANWAHEAFMLLRMLYPEETRSGKRFGSYWRWVKEYFQVGDHWSQWAVGEPLDDSEAAWARFRDENWGDRYLLRLRDDCLDLPPLTRQLWRCRMDKEQRRVYKALEKDFVTWLESGVEVAAWSKASQLVKLLKIATGLDSLEPGQKSASYGSGKLTALKEILVDRPRPTLVLAHFRNSVEACARAAREVGCEAVVCHGEIPMGRRREAIRSFQRGNAAVLCASLETISEGMNLQVSGADQCVFVEKSWRPSRNEQAVRRLHRMGTENPVLCIDLATEGTVDYGVIALLKQKTDQQMKALRPRDLRGLVA
jgi:hypothetical protein